MSSRWGLKTVQPSSGFGRFHVPRRLVLQQLFGLVTDTTEITARRLVLVHQIDGFAVPLPGVFLVAELPVGHCENKRPDRVTSVTQSDRLFQRLDGRLPFP